MSNSLSIALIAATRASHTLANSALPNAPVIVDIERPGRTFAVRQHLSAGLRRLSEALATRGAVCDLVAAAGRY